MTRIQNGRSVGTSAPPSPETNDFWYDTSADVEKRWNGSAWIPQFATDVVSGFLPWIVDLNVFMEPSGQNHWVGLSAQAGLFMGGTKYSVGNSDDSDYIQWDVILAAGTWTLQTMSQNQSNKGIITAKLDGTTIGTIDTYAASSTPNALGSITGITVASSGKHTLQFRNTTKNASSSGYVIALQHVRLIRTA